MLATADQTAGPNGLNIFVGNFAIFLLNSKIYVFQNPKKKLHGQRGSLQLEKKRVQIKIFLTPCN